MGSSYKLDTATDHGTIPRPPFSQNLGTGNRTRESVKTRDPISDPFPFRAAKQEPGTKMAVSHWAAGVSAVGKTRTQIHHAVREKPACHQCQTGHNGDPLV